MLFQQAIPHLFQPTKQHFHLPLLKGHAVQDQVSLSVSTRKRKRVLKPSPKKQKSISKSNVKKPFYPASKKLQHSAKLPSLHPSNENSSTTCTLSKLLTNPISSSPSPTNDQPVSDSPPSPTNDQPPSPTNDQPASVSPPSPTNCNDQPVSVSPPSPPMISQC